MDRDVESQSRNIERIVGVVGSGFYII